MSDIDQILFTFAALLILSVLASRATGLLGVPSLLIFLLIGLAVGPHGLNFIHPLNAHSAQGLGSVALVFILFSGGLDTELERILPVLGPALLLSTFGVLIATLLIGVFAHLALGFSLLQGCLLGATIASTDVAAVFAVLRSRAVRFSSGIAPLLELESALNDPMAVFLSVALLGFLLHSDGGALRVIPFFLKQVAFGTLIGWGGGRFASLLLNRVRLEVEGLYPVLSVGLIFLVYAFTQWAGGSGYLAVYVAGVVLRSRPLLNRRSLTQFQSGLAWLMQIAMFLAMGVLVDPRQLWAVTPQGLALSAFLIFVARPASVAICLPGKRFKVGEKLMIAWGGLRGAVPIILALFLLGKGIPQAPAIFHLVFFVTFTSVLIQGTTVPQVARWLKANLPLEEHPAFPLELNPKEKIPNNLIEVNLSQGAKAIGKTLLALDLPKGSLVVLVRRGSDFMVPTGSTLLQAQDTLLVVTEGSTSAEIRGSLI